MKKSRPIVILLMLVAVLLLPLLSDLFTAPVSAATPTYTVSKAYRESQFYENLRQLRLTGDGAADVLAVALSQLGYHEGNSEAELDGKNLSGTRDFVEYNVLYGKLDNDQGNGLSYGYYWCASFVNWCLRQANVSKEDSSGAFVSCWRWLDAFTAAGRYSPKAGYSPKPGDLIFFKDQYTYVSTGHVGLVLYADNARVYTIEGNTSSGSEFSKDGNYVAMKSYPLSSTYIVGYGSPAYQVKEGLIRPDYAGNHLSVGQYVSRSDIKCYHTAEMEGSPMTLSAHTVFSVTAVYTDCMKLRVEADTQTVEVYADIRGRAIQLAAAERTYSLFFRDADGRTLFPTQFLSENGSAVIPQERPSKKNAGFLGWSEEQNGRDALLLPGDEVRLADRDLTLWAVWDETFYLVTFQTPEGALIGQRYGYYGDSFEPPVPTESPEGMAFAGWDRTVETVITGDAVYTAVFLPEEEVTDSAAADTTAEALTEEAPSESKPADSKSHQNKEKGGCRSTVPLGCVCVMMLLVPVFCRRKEGVGK